MHASTTQSSSADASPRRKKFDRWLHRNYSRSFGIHHFIARRLKPAGIALALILVLAGCLGVGHRRDSIYQLVSLSFAMLALGLPYSMARRATLEAERELPRYATAGQTLRYTVKVRNRGKRRLARAWLTEIPPDSRPSMDEFTLLREPGEEERNSFDRTFAYYRWQWLLLRNRLFPETSSPQEIRLKSGEQGSVTIDLTPLRRGVMQVRDLRLLLPDAFGLFQNCVRVTASPATLMVLPKRFPLPPIELPGSAAFKITGEVNTNRIGNSGEFVGLREYRPGDPMRQIHWKSWARTGRPIVKELEDTYYPRYGLVLDTLSTSRSDVTFEEAVSVAASFAAAIDTNDSLLDLMFIKNEAHIVTAGRGLERVGKLLEVLAAVTPERVDHFEGLAQMILRHADDLSACIVVLNGWDENRAEFLRSLEKGGVICSTIIIGHGSAPPDIPGYWLESGHIARDLIHLPRRLGG